jgi:uncharacterized protein YqjF (DUF2071 family)
VLLHASWEDVVFLHFLVERHELRGRIPEPLRLDLPFGEAWITVVGLRSRGPAPLPPRLLRGVPTHSQVNVRTYVAAGSERAIYLLDQAVSSTAMAAAGRVIGLHPRPADVSVERDGDFIDVQLGDGRRPRAGERLKEGLAARVRIVGPTHSASRDLIGGALLERYVVYEGRPPRRAEVEHAPWVIQRLEVESLETGGLLPESARLAAAHYGTPRVAAVGVPHGLQRAFATGAIAEPA